MVSIELPIGVGALSWITLELEIRGWDRFQNRRQIASYTGLCPGIHNSNGRGREGHINRCGNSVVRYTLTTARCGCYSALSNRSVALGHRSSHGSRTWSAIPANYDSETKRLTLATTSIWERRV